MLASLSPNLRGMLGIMVASSIFTVNDTFVKIATQSWPVSQVMVFRGAIAMLMALGLVLAQGHAANLRNLANPLVLLRSVLEGAVGLLFILALARMPIADLTAILMLSPLVITALAVVLFKEQVGWRRWSAIGCGFLGMLLVVQPGGGARPEGYGLAAMLGVLSVLGVAGRDLTTRRIGSLIPSTVITLASTAGSFLAGCTLSSFEVWQPWTFQPMVVLAAAAVVVTLGNMLMVSACRGVDLSVVAPFRYTALITAILIGLFVFGELPSALALVGMGVIVASGVYLMHRERLRRLSRS